jgi:hypothetical protein
MCLENPTFQGVNFDRYLDQYSNELKYIVPIGNLMKDAIAVE